MSAMHFGRIAAQARRLRQTHVWELVRMFDPWMHSLPDPGEGFRQRTFSVFTTFWLFFSPGGLL